MLYYNLNKSLSIETIAKDLKKLFNSIPQNELENSILKITIQKINSYQGDSPLPKIEYKDHENCST